MFKNLSMAFDTLNHNLSIAKLGAYGLERESLTFIKTAWVIGSSGILSIKILDLGKR